jgi:hypothetical protein
MTHKHHFAARSRATVRRSCWTALACLVATVAACDTAGEPSPQQALAPAIEAASLGAASPRALQMQITMPAADMARLAYVTAAVRRGDVRLDILAGALLELHGHAPTLSQAQLAAATAQIAAIIAAPRGGMGFGSAPPLPPGQLSGLWVAAAELTSPSGPSHSSSSSVATSAAHPTRIMTRISVACLMRKSCRRLTDAANARLVV